VQQQVEERRRAVEPQQPGISPTPCEAIPTVIASSIQ
jgi:hypothetical protein